MTAWKQKIKRIKIHKKYKMKYPKLNLKIKN